MKKITLLLSLLFMTVVFTSLKITSNPNCPTGYSTAPSLNGTTVRNCTSCHSGTVNPAGGSVTAIGLPTTYTAGLSYPFSVKITHSAANRLVWGVAIKAIDTLTHAVVGTWTTTNPNTSIKGTPTIANGNYELSHANAATSTATNTYTYSNLTWTAPALPTAVQSRVKFYVSAVAGNSSGDEAGDYVYSTSLTSNQYVAPTPCTFTYGQWTTCSNGTQTRSYTTSPAGCTGTPPADSIQRTCSVPCTFTYGAWTTCSNGTQTRSYTTSPAGCTGTPPTDSITRTCTVVPPTSLPTPVTITGTINPGVCDTIRTFTVQNQSNVFYAWVISGVGNYITNGQGTNVLTAVVKAGGSVTVSLSNTAGSIPSTSLAFTKAVPPTPTAMNGSLAPCPNSTFTYSLTNPLPSATQVAPNVFRWTTPAFTTITSANADSSQITLNFGGSYVGGTLSAKGVTNCGAVGSAKSIVLAPTKAVDVVSSTGFWNGCIGNSVNYFVVSPVTSISPVSGYRWTTPAFTSITSANADSSQITLQFNTGYKGGSLKVQSSTSCGSLGTAVSKTLTHIGCAAGQRNGIEEETLVTDLVSLFPNPNNGEFTINIQTGDKITQKALIQIINLQGNLLDQYTVGVNGGVISKKITNTSLKTGMYFITYIIGDKKKTIKMYVTQ